MIHVYMKYRYKYVNVFNVLMTNIVICKNKYASNDYKTDTSDHQIILQVSASTHHPAS